jgi:hypothetical protein
MSSHGSMSVIKKMKLHLRACLILVGILLPLSVVVLPFNTTVASADTLIFDSDGNPANGATDGSGNWVPGVSTNFYNGTIDVATAPGDIARFGNGGTLSGSATVNVGSGLIGGLIFGATTGSGYFLTASAAETLTIGSSGIFINSGAQTTTLGSATLGLALGANQSWINNARTR